MVFSKGPTSFATSRRTAADLGTPERVLNSDVLQSADLSTAADITQVPFDMPEIVPPADEEKEVGSNFKRLMRFAERYRQNRRVLVVPRGHRFLFGCGNHRIFVGDAAFEEHVRRVAKPMDAEQ